MELDKVLENRRSIRQFSSKKIPWNILSEVLDAATLSPSSGNVQNFRLVIVTKEDKKEQLAVASLKQNWIKAAPAIIVVCADYAIIKRLYEERYQELSLQNCTIAAYNIMLKATSLGLATCYVSVFDADAVSRTLKLPDDVIPLIMIPIGYPDEEPEKIRHVPLQSILRFEEYSKKKRQ